MLPSFQNKCYIRKKLFQNKYNIWLLMQINCSFPFVTLINIILIFESNINTIFFIYLFNKVSFIKLSFLFIYFLTFINLCKTI